MQSTIGRLVEIVYVVLKLFATAVPVIMLFKEGLYRNRMNIYPIPELNSKDKSLDFSPYI